VGSSLGVALAVDVGSMVARTNVDASGLGLGTAEAVALAVGTGLGLGPSPAGLALRTMKRNTPTRPTTPRPTIDAMRRTGRRAPPSVPAVSAAPVAAPSVRLAAVVADGGLCAVSD
jgi:hypothetical protein